MIRRFRKRKLITNTCFSILARLTVIITTTRSCTSRCLSPWATWKWTRGNVMACAGVWGKFMACYLASRVSVEHMIGWTPDCDQRLLSWIQNVRRRGIAASTFSQLLQSVRRRCHELRAEVVVINHLTPDGHYIGRTAQLTSRCCILCIYSTNILTEYFKHAA